MSDLDLISRQAAIDTVNRMADRIDTGDIIDYRDVLVECFKVLPVAQQEQRWIPIKTRPMDEEERAYYKEVFDWQLDDEDAVMFVCPMPEDGQEVWVCSKCGNVWQDTCFIDDGIWLEGNGDWLDIVAWMPFESPEPWKGESNADNN